MFCADIAISLTIRNAPSARNEDVPNRIPLFFVVNVLYHTVPHVMLVIFPITAAIPLFS